MRAQIETVLTVSEIVEGIKSDVCHTRCKYWDAVPEGKDKDWIFNDEDSPCVNCPLSLL